MPSTEAEYVYAFTFDNQPDYDEAKAEGENGLFFNSSVRPTVPYVRL